MNEFTNSLIKGAMAKRKDRFQAKSPRSGKKVSYTSLEARREVLLRRLGNLHPKLRANRGYASARVLLGSSYRRANLTARLAVLQTAQFMISVLEQLPPL